MSTDNVHVVVLAAGQGRRMRSKTPKVLHRLAGRPLIEHVLRASDGLAPASVTVVVGHEGETVQNALSARPELAFVTQSPQLGTAHALRQAEPGLRGKAGTLVLLSGDVPLLSVANLQQLVATHTAAHAAATVVTACVERPEGYGRIVRADGKIARIVEHKDASQDERRIQEINSGIYAFDLGPLFEALGQIASSNAQREYYLTDLIAAYRQRGLVVETVQVADPHEVLGINSRAELGEVARIVRQTKNAALLEAGVTIVDPDATYIDLDVEVGPDTVIHPGAVIEGRTRIGASCEVHAHVRIVDSDIADRVSINSFSMIVGARLGAGASIGPFAHLRRDSVVGENARVGNFVELKNTTLGEGSKANHLAYLGDATIGRQVNIGAGTITCNYDGERKHRTVIEDGAFIGSDSQLIAPVTVGEGAYVGAGSSISEDVPPGSLGIARSRQTNVEGWVQRRKRS